MADKGLDIVDKYNLEVVQSPWRCRRFAHLRI